MSDEAPARCLHCGHDHGSGSCSHVDADRSEPNCHCMHPGHWTRINAMMEAAHTAGDIERTMTCIDALHGDPVAVDLCRRWANEQEAK